MSPHKKDARKNPMTEASASWIHQEVEPDTLRPIYDDTIGFIEKVNSLKWGEVFQMFKNQSFPLEEKYEYELNIFRNIKKLRLHRVASHTSVFPCVDTISWLV